MATAERLIEPTRDAAAYQSQPGIATPAPPGPQVLPPEQLQQGPFPGGLTVTFVAGGLNPAVDVVKFGAIRDPKLRLVQAIPLNVSREESHFVVEWRETGEFGTGETLSGALDDFAGSLRELYHELFSAGVHVGPDLEKVKQTLAEYIQPRK